MPLKLRSHALATTTRTSRLQSSREIRHRTQRHYTNINPETAADQ